MPVTGPWYALTLASPPDFPILISGAFADVSHESLSASVNVEGAISLAGEVATVDSEAMSAAVEADLADWLGAFAQSDHEALNCDLRADLADLLGAFAQSDSEAISAALEADLADILGAFAEIDTDCTSANVTVNAGPTPRAVCFDATDDQYLASADGSGLAHLGTQFALALWVFPVDTGEILTTIVSRWDVPNQTTAAEFRLEFSTNTGAVLWIVRTTSGTVNWNTTQALTFDTWNFVYVERNANLLGIRVGDTFGNLNALSTISIFSDTPSWPALPTHFGALQSFGGFVQHLEGAIDSAGLWMDGRPDPVSIYNSGAGKSFVELTAADLTDLRSWWDFDNFGDAIGMQQLFGFGNTGVPVLCGGYVGNAPRNLQGSFAETEDEAIASQLTVVGATLWLGSFANLEYTALSADVSVLGFVNISGSHAETEVVAESADIEIVPPSDTTWLGGFAAVIPPWLGSKALAVTQAIDLPAT